MHANVPERRLRRRRQSTPRAVATPFRRSSSAGREAGERAKKKKIPITVVDGVYYTRVAVGVTTIAFKLKLFRSDSSSDGLPPPMKALQNALGPAYLASYARCAAICTPPNSYEMRAGRALISLVWSSLESGDDEKGVDRSETALQNAAARNAVPEVLYGEHLIRCIMEHLIGCKGVYV